MNLGTNIYNLLKRQTTVYVKGLGSFKRVHTPATFDKAKNVYLPPLTYIDFDAMDVSGYDFISYVQQVLQKDRQESEDIVLLAIEALYAKILEDGQVKLDNLGYLVSYGNSFVFKAIDVSGFNFQPVVVPQEVRQPEKPILEDNIVEALHQDSSASAPAEDAVPEVEDKPAEEEAAAIAAVAEQGSSTPARVEEQPAAVHVPAQELDAPEQEHASADSKRGNNSIWYVLLIGLALAVAGFLYYQNFWNVPPTTVAPQVADTLAVAAPDSVALTPVDTVALQDTLPPMSVDSLADISPAERPMPAKHQWQLVIGSHRTLAQAYEQAESYQKAGYAHVRVIPSILAKNRKKVIWDSYETKEQVDSAMAYVQKHIIKDAWPDKISK